MGCFRSVLVFKVVTFLQYFLTHFIDRVWSLGITELFRQFNLSSRDVQNRELAEPIRREPYLVRERRVELDILHSHIRHVRRAYLRRLIFG